MSISVRSVVASVLLAVGSTAALAAVPSVPLPQPVAGPTPNPDTGNGGLIVSAYDSVRGVSVVQYLGLNLDSFLPGAANATPEGGLTLDFGTLGSWSSVFTGSDAANIHYTVTAADFTTNNISDTFIGKRLATTLNPAGSVIPMKNGVLSNVTLNERSFIASNVDGAAGCNGVNPCVALTALDGGYAGGANWGDRLGTGSGVSAASTVDTAIGFYFIAANSNGNGVTTIAPTTAYANSTGAAQWLLTSSGHLTYSVPGSVSAVPLPAAVWLLLSGLGGLGVVSRRRTAVAA